MAGADEGVFIEIESAEYGDEGSAGPDEEEDETGYDADEDAITKSGKGAELYSG